MSKSINDTNTSYTTPTGNGQSIILDGPSDTDTQTVISNGTWDNIDLNGHTAYVYINIGAAINGNGGILTENNAANSGAYLYGNYAGLYATLINQSTANVTLTGDANIVNDSNRTNIDENYAAKITGVNAYLTLDPNSTGASEVTGTYNGITLTLNNLSTADLTVNGNGVITNNNTNNDYSATINGNNASLTMKGDGYSNLIGTYNGLNYADVATGSQINASGSGNNYLGEDGGSITFTQGDGTLTINGINDVYGVDNLIGSGYNSNITLTGNNEIGDISGNWNNLNGTISGEIYSSNATFNNASVYNEETSGTMTITGTGNGDITYNGIANATGDIEGTWKNITATIQSRDTFNATATGDINLTADNNDIENIQNIDGAGYSNITLNDGSSLNGTLKYGTNTINSNDSSDGSQTNNINLTLGSSTTTINADSGTSGTINEGTGQLNINYNISNNQYGNTLNIENFNQGRTQILLTNITGTTFNTSNISDVQITHGGVTDNISVGNAQSVNIVPITGTNNALLTFS